MHCRSCGTCRRHNPNSGSRHGTSRAVRPESEQGLVGCSWSRNRDSGSKHGLARTIPDKKSRHCAAAAYVGHGTYEHEVCLITGTDNAQPPRRQYLRKILCKRVFRQGNIMRVSGDPCRPAGHRAFVDNRDRNAMRLSKFELCRTHFLGPYMGACTA